MSAANLGNQLWYNGVKISFQKTTKFEQQNVFTEDGTDILYTKITIGVTGILNECVQGITPQKWVENNRPKLMVKRKQLCFIVGSSDSKTPSNVSEEDDVLLRSPPVGFASDAQHGPTPIAFNITRFDGATWMFYYEIETAVTDCDMNDQAILSNRWECTHNIDGDYYSTRIINGLVELNGMFYDNDNGMPDALGLTMPTDYTKLDGIIVPKIPKNWKRESVNVAIGSNGLKIHYTIVDKEQHLAIPKPAVAVEATYTEQTGKDQHIFYCQMDVMVRGQPGSTDGKSDTAEQLLEIMAQILLSRLDPVLIKGTDTSIPGTQWVIGWMLKENIFKNEFSCQLKMGMARDTRKTQIGANLMSNGGLLTRVGLPLKVDDIINKKARTPQDKGNYLGYLFANHVTDPCSDKNKELGEYTKYQIVQLTDVDTDPDKVTGTVTPADLKDDIYTLYSSNHLYRPWTDYTIDVTYGENRHYQQFAVMYSDADDCVLIRTANPTVKKMVHWKATRINKWPLIPSPDDLVNDADRVISTQINAGAVEMEQDGKTRRFIMSGVYEYAQKKQMHYENNAPNIPVAVNPVTKDTWGSSDSSTSEPVTAFPTTNVVDGIIGEGTIPNQNQGN